MSRVESASGARYSAHNEQTRKFEPIAPVGTNYTPVGKVDIAALRSAAPSAAPSPVVPSAPRPAAVTPAASAPPFRSAGFGSTAAASRVPQGTWDAPKPTAVAPPPPTASRPPPTVVSAQRSAPAPAHSSTVTSSNVTTKPAEEDRIGPVVSPTDDDLNHPSGIHSSIPCNRAPPTHPYHYLPPRGSTTLSKRAHRLPWPHSQLLRRAPRVLAAS